MVTAVSFRFAPALPQTPRCYVIALFLVSVFGSCFVALSNRSAVKRTVEGFWFARHSTEQRTTQSQQHSYSYAFIGIRRHGAALEWPALTFPLFSTASVTAWTSVGKTLFDHSAGYHELLRHRRQVHGAAGARESQPDTCADPHDFGLSRSAQVLAGQPG